MSEDLQTLVNRANEIQQSIETINSALQDQFQTSDGITYAAQQSWVKLINMELAVKRIESGTKAIEAILGLLFVAMLAHVIHHW